MNLYFLKSKSFFNIIVIIAIIIGLVFYFKPEHLNDISGNILPEPVVVLPQAAAVGPTAQIPVTDKSLSASDLLPNYNDAKAMAAANPVTDILKDQNFLIGGYPVGIDTTVQSNKIPYLDLRSLPLIPKETVGPWNQSSYENSGGSIGRRQFEIGGMN